LTGHDAPRTAVRMNFSATDLERLVLGRHPDPSRILGPWPDEAQPRLTIRAFAPGAERARVWLAGGELPATRIHAAGVFEVQADGVKLDSPASYRWRFVWPDGREEETYDAYAFPPELTDFDLHLLAEGTHLRAYDCLGAHPRSVAGVPGVRFAVWAPRAQRVSVVGDFNRWDGRVHGMRPRGGGVWELFVPGVSPGALYKYEILAADGCRLLLKSDPFGRWAELRPKSASVVVALDGDAWNDQDWLSRRAQWNWQRTPVSIYEVHLGSWRRGEGNRWLTYRELAEQLPAYAKQMGFTHLELMPVLEHPHDASWGYQPIGYFAPTSRYGRPQDFMLFVDRCHAEGLGVLLDWVPAHFARDGHGLGAFDGEPLYEPSDPRMATHPDWGSYVFDLERPQVRNFLLASALFWLEQYHADGLRADAVASLLYLDYSRSAGQWVPNVFGGRENLAAIAWLKWLNEVVHARFPGALVIAEESTAWPMVSRPTWAGGLGFSMKWNLGWMNDTLRFFRRDPIHRRYHLNDLTFSLLYAFSENFVLPLSHDEVVHGKGALLEKMPGDEWQRLANLRLLLAWQFAHPGKKLLFMGSELGMRREWSHERELDWGLLEDERHRGVQNLVRDLNRLYRTEPALYALDFEPSGFEWIDCQDAENTVLALLRRAPDGQFLVVVLNCTPVVRTSYRLGVPAGGRYRELLNTDSCFYGGSNVGNGGWLEAESVGWHGRPYSLALTLPPLGALFLKPAGSGS
jgi:1,4-alpha-glucan branching enzyme